MAYRRFWEELDRFGDALALIEPMSGREWSYRRLAGDVAAGADELASAEKRLVFLFAATDAGGILCYLSALGAGHAVHLSPLGIDEAGVAELIARYRPELVLWHAGTPAAVLAEDYAAIDPLWGYHALERRHAGPAPDPELALLLAGSGSAAPSKLVRLADSAIAASAEQIAQALAIAAEDRAVTTLPITSSDGLAVVNSHLARGAALIVEGRSMAELPFWNAIAAAGVTSLAAAPGLYESLRRDGLDQLNLPRLKLLMTCGSAGGWHLIQRLHDHLVSHGLRPFIVYGPSEACAGISVLPPATLATKLGAVGQALPQGRIEISGAGEIVYRGANVMMGHAEGRDDLARGDELRGVLRTGDRGRIDAEGCLWLTGRLDPEPARAAAALAL